MTPPSTGQSLEPLWREIKNTGDEMHPRKQGYLNVIGILKSDDDPPDPPPFSNSKYERNRFLEFFDTLTEATHGSDSADSPMPKKSPLELVSTTITSTLENQVDGLNGSLRDEDVLKSFLEGSNDHPTYQKLLQLSLEIFGGHIEHLLLLWTARSHPNKIKQYVETRYSNIPEEQKPFTHSDPLKQALIQAYSRLSVAPVYVRASCKFREDTYFILQLCPKPYDPITDTGVSPNALRHLHTTFSIKREDDHPGEWGDIIGTHRQIRLQGGMQQLAKRNPEQDAIPILLENSRILSSEEMVVWD